MSTSTWAVRRAVGYGLFLFSLVIELNDTAVSFAQLQGLRAAAVTFWMGSLLGGGPRDLSAADQADLAGAWGRWFSVVEGLVRGVRAEATARASLEDRYLGGHPALFADAATDWAALEDQLERLDRLASMLGPALVPKMALGRSRRRSGEEATSRARDLADSARVKALELLGERSRAAAIMTRRLASAPPSNAPTSPTL